MPCKHSSTRARCFALAALMFLVFVFYFPLGCAVGAGSAMNSAAQQAQAQTATGVVPASLFGMVVEHAGVQPAVAVGARRLWDPSITWAALEPARGAFAWAALDAEVAAAPAGTKITLVLAMTPAWASSQPGLPSAWGAGATAMPADTADWDAYVAAVATRYRGRIAAYEVWSHPEDPTEWSGDPASMGSEMAALAVQAAATLHTADPAAVLVSPAFSSAGLQAFLAAGGGAAVNIFAASLDAPGAAPEAMTEALAQIRAVSAGAGFATTPIWNEQDSWTLPQDGASASTQAAWVARSLLLNAGFGIARMDWFAWDEAEANTLQMTDADGLPTAAALAYGEVEGWLTGAQMNGCAATAGGLWTCGLVRDGQTEWVLWSPGGTVQTSALGAGSVTDITGNETAVGTGGTVSVGGSPVLLR